MNRILFVITCVVLLLGSAVFFDDVRGSQRRHQILEGWNDQWWGTFIVKLKDGKEIRYNRSQLWGIFYEAGSDGGTGGISTPGSGSGSRGGTNVGTGVTGQPQSGSGLNTGGNAGGGSAGNSRSGVSNTTRPRGGGSYAGTGPQSGPTSRSSGTGTGGGSSTTGSVDYSKGPRILDTIELGAEGHRCEGQLKQDSINPKYYHGVYSCNFTREIFTHDDILLEKIQGGRIVLFIKGINTRYVGNLSADGRAVTKGDFTGDYYGTWTAKVTW